MNTKLISKIKSSLPKEQWVDAYNTIEHQNPITLEQFEAEPTKANIKEIKKLLLHDYIRAVSNMKNVLKALEMGKIEDSKVLLIKYIEDHKNTISDCDIWK